MKNGYATFLNSKLQFGCDAGFEPTWMPEFLFDFQVHLVDWITRKGRGAIMADCGLGKTPMQLVWAQNVYKHTGKPVLIATPLAVGLQTVSEAHKFGIDAAHNKVGKIEAPIVITNYQRLHYFNADDFGGMSCDESGILKNSDGKIKAQVTEFMRRIQYRSLWTATPAPNDYIELGNSSEALGYLGYLDMLQRFFKNQNGNAVRSRIIKLGGSFERKREEGKWRFRGHAERDFWRWVVSWARAIRKPSDFGFDDGRFVLPPLETREHIVKARTKSPDMLFDLPAVGLAEQRSERRRTLKERCEMAAEIANSDESPCVSWCALNDEGKLLTDLIDGAVEIAGDNDDEHEEILAAFANGEIKKLVTKSQITGWGLNWQFCRRFTVFPSHSFEQYYQLVRRFWRFGQTEKVVGDMITSEGEMGVLKNMNRKAAAAEKMFSHLVQLMNDELKITSEDKHKTKTKIPVWL